MDTLIQVRITLTDFDLFLVDEPVGSQKRLNFLLHFVEYCLFDQKDHKLW